MTKKEAVENHRKMWRWIAEETLKRKRKVFKDDYLSLLYDYQHNYEDITNECFCCEYVSQLANECFCCEYVSQLANECFCCEYVSQFTNDVCAICPITWPGGHCSGYNGLYTKFTYAGTLEQRAELAHTIAELPERETTVFDIMEDNFK